MRIIKQFLFAFLLGIVSLAHASFVDVGPGISIGGKASLTSVRAVASAGFKLVRLPSVEPPDLAIIDEAIRLKLRVVVDFHPDLSWYADPFAVYGIPSKMADWAQSLSKYTEFQVALEVFNEPRMKARVSAHNAILAAAISAIREVSLERWIIVTNPALGDVDWFDGPLLKWVPPKADRLIVPMHYYRPYVITHPEHYRTGKTAALVPALPLPWTGTTFEARDWANRELHFQKYVNWCRENGVSPWIGEAGCFETVPDRAAWFRAIMGLATTYKIPVCWWAWGDEFGVRPQAKDREEILKLMLAS